MRPGLGTEGVEGAGGAAQWRRVGAGPGALVGNPGGIDFCAVCPRPRSKQTPSVCRLRRVAFNYPPGSLIEMILNQIFLTLKVIILKPVAPGRNCPSHPYPSPGRARFR